jgi:cytochrome c peroxidase
VVKSRWWLALGAGAFGFSACGDGGPAQPEPGLDLRQEAAAQGLAPLPAEPVRPVDNPLVPARVELGHLLFFDPILSGPMDVACSTCHLPRFAFTDGRQFPSGAGGTGLGPDRTLPSPHPLREMPRNSPPVLNTGLYGRGGTSPSSNGTMFWSGSAFGIEDQVLNPIAADNELRGLSYAKSLALDSVLLRIRSLSDYVDRFAAAFPDEAAMAEGDPDALVTPTTLRLAMAAYLRELVTPNAPLDRFLAGDDDALTARQKDGLALFIGEAGCVGCHSGPLLSDFSMHVIGGAQEGLGRDTTPGDDLGWGEHGGTPYSFRTPPLRQVALTAPYLHAGTAASLRELLEFKNRGVSEHPSVSDGQLDPLMTPLGLSASQLDALEAFLGALTDPLVDAGPLFEPPAAVPSGLEVPR